MKKPLRLFEGYGVELEYMIVDEDTLKVSPIADELIKKVAGEYVSDVEFGEIGWSNELVLHVIELKTNGPAKSLTNLDSKFFENVININKILEEFNCMLLPTGAHPFMDPFTESKLWNHEYNQVYEAYNRIFDCRGHGWSTAPVTPTSSSAPSRCGSTPCRVGKASPSCPTSWPRSPGPSTV